MSASRSPKSFRSAVSQQAPLLIALVAIALVIGFTRTRQAQPAAPKPAPTRVTPAQPLVPSEPEPIPEESPLAALRAENAELPCDVDDVLARKCRRCHTTPARHGAPFPLYTWAELQVPRSSQPLYQHVGRVVQSGYMPYRIVANPPVEPLTEAEKKTLLDWVSAGAPRGACKVTTPKKGRPPARP